MLKKLIGVAAGAGLVLTMAGSAFAFGWIFPSNDVESGNFAVVKNFVVTKADTGDNEIGGMVVGGGSITTGAATAVGSVLNQVNTTQVGCDCLDGDVTTHNFGTVKNFVITKADTGDNEIGGKFVFGGAIRTGAAGAAARRSRRPVRGPTSPAARPAGPPATEGRAGGTTGRGGPPHAAPEPHAA